AEAEREPDRDHEPPDWVLAPAGGDQDPDRGVDDPDHRLAEIGGDVRSPELTPPEDREHRPQAGRRERDGGEGPRQPGGWPRTHVTGSSAGTGRRPETVVPRPVADTTSS